MTKVYHIAHEPSFKTATLHFWTNCNLECRGCYCKYQPLYFNLYDDPVSRLKRKAPESPPKHFLSVERILGLLKELDLENVLLMGTEPSLDPELPSVAKALHEEIKCRNIIMTNGLKLADMEHVDTVLFSLKAYSEDVHIGYTGKSNKRILDNFAKIYRSGKKLQAITLVIPDYIDAHEIEKIAWFISKIDRKIPLTIHAYFPVPHSPWMAADNEDVKEAVKLARKHLDNVPYRTLGLKRVGEPAVRIF